MTTTNIVLKETGESVHRIDTKRMPASSTLNVSINFRKKTTQQHIHCTNH